MPDLRVPPPPVHSSYSMSSLHQVLVAAQTAAAQPPMQVLSGMQFPAPTGMHAASALLLPLATRQASQISNTPRDLIAQPSNWAAAPEGHTVAGCRRDRRAAPSQQCL